MLEGPFGCLLQKASSPRSGNVINTSKTQINPNEEDYGCPEKYTPNEETRRNSRRKASKLETGKLPNKELKVRIMNMLDELQRKADEHKEVNKELKNIKNRTDLENTKSEIKNTLEGINSRFDDRGMDN